MPSSVKKRYFELLRDGYKGGSAARVVGVSTSCGSKWFLEASGVMVPDPVHILTEIKNRGESDVLMLVCDGLKGLPEAVETV